MSITATLLAQIAAFVLVVWLVNRLLWKPLAQAMNKRQTDISDGLAAADEGRQMLEQAATEKQTIIKEAQEKSKEIIAQAEKQAQNIIATAKDEARTEGEREKQAAQAEIANQLNRAKERLRKEVGSLVALGAERLLKREVDASSHAKAIKELESEL